MYNKIIFVCTGNTCRSPMAEAILKRLLKNNGIDLEVISRGLNVFNSMPANEKAIKVMDKYKNDLTNHMAMQFYEEDLDENSLVLTMTRGHKKILEKLFPEYKNNIFTLKEYVNEDGDVVDPYGGNIEIYEECAFEIEKLIKKLVSMLEKSNN